MRARVDAAGFLQVGAKVARGGFLLDDGFFAAWIFEVVDANLEWMKIDVAVGAVARAKAAADAPIFDDDFERIAPADSADGAADHTERIAALAAGSGDKEILEAEAVADETCDAVVGIGTGVHAGIAARAFFEVQNQQALRLH